MIERYVFIKLNADHATDAGRAAVAAHSREIFPTIPGVVGVRVGVPADEAALRSWDISIAVQFASTDDVEPYRQHPIHLAYVNEYLAARKEVLKAWSFDVA